MRRRAQGGRRGDVMKESEGEDGNEKGREEMRQRRGGDTKKERRRSPKDKEDKTREGMEMRQDKIKE